MTYRAYNLTRKEYVEGSMRDVGRWLSALLCNDVHSASIGRWVGDRVAVQSVDARPGVVCYVNQRAHKHYENVTSQLGLAPATST